MTSSYVRNAVENCTKKYAVIDAPLLIEAGMENICDEIWLVCANEKTRLERVMKRDNITKERAIMRFRNQMSEEQLRKYADFVIENNGDIDRLREQIYERVGK